MSRRDPGRPLTGGERALAADMFGRAIDCARVRLHRRAWWPVQPPQVVMAPDGDMWFHHRGDTWAEDFADAPLGLTALFVHELTHVWQAQRGGRWFLPLARHPFCRYRYTLVPGRRLDRYGLEQQAEIMRHAFLARRRGAPDPMLERLLADAGLSGTGRHG